MARRRRSYIDGVDIGIVYELLCVGIPLAYMVTLGIQACLGLAAAHHGLNVRALDLCKGRARLLLGHLAASYKSPTYLFHLAVCYYLCAKVAQTEDNAKEKR